MNISKRMLLTVGLALPLLGCAENKKVGGPGATTPDQNKPMVGHADNTFSLDPPNLTTNVKQGESKVVTIGIDRGKNFDQDVTLSFENVPQGLSIEPRKSTIKKSDKETSVTLKAAEDAAINTHVIKIVGQAANGPPATNEMKVDVEKK
jgi:hypothetical protein